MSHRPRLTIYDTPRYGVIREDSSKIGESIFKDVYIDALKSVSGIVKLNKNVLKQSMRNISPEQFNTAIAFVGARGSGKSTAMCNFAGLLSEISPTINLDWAQDPSLDLDALKSKTFHVLNIIDSAQLGIKETIIGRISALMYDAYKEIVRSNSPQLSAEKKRDFIKTVTEVNKYAVMYHTGEWFKNTESLLEDTYHVSSLQNEMKHLVASYLRLVSGKDDPTKDDYLVISIDDLDMGMENSYSVMEEIRKFLCIPNLIVLSTLSMDQIHISLKSKFEQLLEIKTEATTDKAIMEDLAFRYIEKLFPYDRQHYMPEVSSQHLHEWKADFVCYQEKEDNQKPFVLNGVLELIWQKTGLILICNADNDHLIIPRNLRSLCHLVTFLQNLPDIDFALIKENSSEIEHDAEKRQKELAILYQNLHNFSRYLTENIRCYESGNISEDDRALANLLVSVIHNLEHVPLLKLNAYIVGDILNYLSSAEQSYYAKIFDSITTIYSPTEDEKTGTTSPANVLNILRPASMHAECISLGDLMFVLGKIDNKSRCWYIRYLIEVIRTLWSAKMTYEYYNNAFASHEGSSYRKAIGELMINPDVNFFTRELPIKIDQHYDFVFYSNIASKYEPFFLKKLSEIQRDWRLLRTFASKYSTERTLHILRPLTSESFIMLLPYYSFDFVYRFYELLHNKIEADGNNRLNFNIKKYTKQLAELSDSYRSSLEIFDIKVALLYGEDGYIFAVLKDMCETNENHISLYDTDTFVLEELKNKLNTIDRNPNYIMNIAYWEQALRECCTLEELNQFIDAMNEFCSEQALVQSINSAWNTYTNLRKEAFEEKPKHAVKGLKDKLLEVFNTPSKKSPKNGTCGKKKS